MKLATVKKNPSARETDGSRKASMTLPEDDSCHKALFLLITLDFIWLESVQKVVGFKWKLDFDLVKKVWE